MIAVICHISSIENIRNVSGFYYVHRILAALKMMMMKCAIQWHCQHQGEKTYQRCKKKMTLDHNILFNLE